MPRAQRVHIVDDDQAIREALSWLFASRGLATITYPSAEGFLQEYRNDADDAIDCLLLDIRMDGMSGLELQDRLTTSSMAHLPIIFLTGHGNVPIAVRALRHGAVDVIEKPFNDNDLVDRVICALNLESELMQRRKQQRTAAECLARLTARDGEVLDRMLQGKYNKVIADEMGVSVRTVEVHRSAILRKMGVRTAVELAHRMAGLQRQSSH